MREFLTTLWLILGALPALAGEPRDAHPRATGAASPVPTDAHEDPAAPVPGAAVGGAPQTRPRGNPAAGEEEASELLRQAIDLYVVGRYREAAERLRPLVERRVLKERADQLEALRAYGISLHLSGGRTGAERAFRDLLRLDPGARMDPAFVRPEVVRFFETVRRRYEGELSEVVRKAGPRGSAAVNLLPPWGQFRNGHQTKGYLLLGGEGAMGALSLVSAVLLYSWRGPTGEFKGHESPSQPLAIANYVSFASLLALVAYGIVDGLYYYYTVPAPRRASDPDKGSTDHIEPSPRDRALLRF